MASAVQIGPKGGSTSSETLRVAFAHAQESAPVRVRLAFQVYIPKKRQLSYVGLRDHTIRFAVRSRRDLEKIHNEVVQLVEQMLQAMGVEPMDALDTLPPEEPDEATVEGAEDTE